MSQSPLGLSQDWDEIRRPAAAIVRLGGTGVSGRADSKDRAEFLGWAPQGIKRDLTARAAIVRLGGAGVNGALASFPPAQLV